MSSISNITCFESSTGFELAKLGLSTHFTSIRYRGAGRSIFGGANIHIFVFCTINFFWNRNLDFKVNCFYSLWTRIYEYWPPPIIDLPAPLIRYLNSYCPFGNLKFSMPMIMWKKKFKCVYTTTIGVANSIIGGEGTHLYIRVHRPWKQSILNEINCAEHEYMNMCPPPLPNYSVCYATDYNSC